MAKETTINVLMIAGSASYAGDADKVEAKAKNVIANFVKDGWIMPEMVVRHQNGYSRLWWLTHSKRLNKKGTPSKLSVGIQEAEVV